MIIQSLSKRRKIETSIYAAKSWMDFMEHMLSDKLEQVRNSFLQEH